MAPIHLLAHPDLTDQLKKTKEGEEEEEIKQQAEERVARWQDVG